MRAPVDDIPAPAFPRGLPWINVAPLRMDQQLGRPVLVEFWDFCRPNSIRTLPYLRAWHARYGDVGGDEDAGPRAGSGPSGLRVIGVHAGGFPPSQDEAAVRAAVQRLGIEYPVVVDLEYEIWTEYENVGWPARYLFSPQGRLFEYHFGEGGYAETERAIAELLQLDPVPEPMAPARPEDDPDALIALQSEDVAGPYSGPYDAGAVWAVLDGGGTITVNGHPVEVDHPGAYELVVHERSTAAVLALEVGEGVECLATCFTPGLAPA